MKQLPLTSRGWAVVAVASLIVMFGAMTAFKKKGTDTVSSNNAVSVEEPAIPLNTLDTAQDPPMPGGFDSDFDSPPPSSAHPGDGELLIDFDIPDEPRPQAPQVAVEDERMPVVWVTETDAKAYSQPGFNMPVVRELEQWEELMIVESSKENWDKVQDLEGEQFWVQKKIVTIIRPQNLSQPSVAEKKVMDFYTQVAHREHDEAYVHLSPEWKQELSFDRFVEGYSRTDSLRSEVVNVFELGEDRFQVDVAMEAVEGGHPVDYLGIYTVERLDGKWYLTSGSLNRQARSGF